MKLFILSLPIPAPLFNSWVGFSKWLSGSQCISQGESRKENPKLPFKQWKFIFQACCKSSVGLGWWGCGTASQNHQELIPIELLLQKREGLGDQHL